MPVEKRIPQRKCIGCQVSKNKNELIRVVRSPTGEITIDHKGKKSGRGAYICHDANCLKKAAKAKRFERSLETSKSEQIICSLAEQIENEQQNPEKPTEVHV